MSEFWLISAPGDQENLQALERMNTVTSKSNLSYNTKFSIPDFKVGTLDSLVGLSDELGKLDTFAERDTAREGTGRPGGRGPTDSLLPLAAGRWPCPRARLALSKAVSSLPGVRRGCQQASPALLSPQGPLLRWLKVNFSEAFIAWIHIKALRVFVESVLRYGLPVNFQAVLLQPHKKSSTKRLREVLNSVFRHLDQVAAASILDASVEIPGLQLNNQDYFPYVYFHIDLSLLD
ncbi:V-type proton ATPase subunit C 2-like [Leptonychotes weddellii]|uniref:V-type proton ATPase subunit C n=1 Tax=Leptonychotes weddellii TaxID=9713 RepID=A0A7F8RZK9_LEPWE|nr:V-type proton ATPase subunit C 2-like [Leptonychotes weddellii]